MREYDKKIHLACLKYFQAITMKAITTKANTVQLYNAITKVKNDLESDLTWSAS